MTGGVSDPVKRPPAYVIAGGRSSRYPGDKALANVGGKPQLVQLKKQLESQGHLVKVVADRGNRYQRIGIHSLVDLHFQAGPMGGLITGLWDRHRCSGDGWILLLGCDQLLWKSQWLVERQDLWSNDKNPVCSIILWPESSRNSPELVTPIPGLYHTCLLPILEGMLAQGQRALLRLIGHSAASVAYFPNQSVHPGEYSFNTPERLATLLTTGLVCESFHKPSQSG
jgi:molybdenum cofactor guanylyltransferase